MAFSGSNRRGPVSSSPTWHRREPPEWPKASVRVWDGRAYSGAQWRTQASADRASLEESGSGPELSQGEISPVNPPSAIAVSIRPSLPFFYGVHSRNTIFGCMAPRPRAATGDIDVTPATLAWSATLFCVVFSARMADGFLRASPRLFTVMALFACNWAVLLPYYGMPADVPRPELLSE